MIDQPKTVSSTDLTLPGVLNLGTAEELKEKFMQSLVLGADLTLDASNVETITTPCLQVLISAGQSIENAGNTLSIHNSSPAFMTALTDLGLNEIFAKWGNK